MRTLWNWSASGGKGIAAAGRSRVWEDRVMRGRTLFAILGVLILAGAASITSLSASTDTLACADFRTTTGTICSGSYLDTQDPNDAVYECLKEGTSGGVSHLEHVWKFCNVPVGAQSIVFEGTRAANTDGDDFQFYYNIGCDCSTSMYQPITGAIINHNFYPTGGLVDSMSLTTTATTDVYVMIKDTAGGSNLDTVKIYYLAVRTN